jgi:glycosyltransferase involved in cell wall biosynthesis
MLVEKAPERPDSAQGPHRNIGPLEDKNPEVILLHASEADQGGIFAATIFYAAALIAAGHPAEIWTPSLALEKRAKGLGVPVFCRKAFRNAAGPIVNPSIVARSLNVRSHAKAIIHQGEKHWLFGRVWLRGAAESVVFHNEKIGQRRLFKHWLALSERNREDLELFARQRGLSRKISLIRNGPLPSASQLSQPRHAKPISAIGALSNFGDRKGIDILIRAFAEVLARGRDARLVLAGNGFEFKKCQALADELGISNKVDWLGWQWDTRAFFQQIDLFCLPSRNEPFGIVVTEAMQAGLPVVATDTSGPRDIVLPGKTGWIVPVEDVAALTAALAEAIEDPAKAAAYGAAGLERYRTTYSLEAAGRALAEALGLERGSMSKSPSATV